MLKIMHTADIHLDSPFSGLPPRLAEARRNDLRAAFTSMMTYAKMTGVDVLLIAGDLFDSGTVTRDTVRLLIREFETFGRPVFISPGNHDPAFPNSVWKRVSFPANVHIFDSEELSAVDLFEPDDKNPGVTVYGWAFTAPDLDTVPITGKRVADTSRINLLSCHCDMTSPRSRDCPVLPVHLEAFGMDYAALGHIHNPPPPGRGNRWCYPGCLEPRGFDELGPKGALIVEIEKKPGSESEVRLKKLRFSKRRYEKSELDLTGAETMTDAADAVKRAVKANGWGEDTLLSLRLTGEIPPAFVIDTEALEETDAGLAALCVEDRTRPAADPAKLAVDPTIRGAVYRQLKPLLESEDEREREVATRALRYALSAVSGTGV